LFFIAYVCHSFIFTSVIFSKGRDFEDESTTTDIDGNTIESASSGSAGVQKFDDGSKLSGRTKVFLTQTTTENGQVIDKDSGTVTAGGTDIGGAKTAGKTFTENSFSVAEDGTQTEVNETGATGNRKGSDELLGDSQTSGNTGSGSITVQNSDGSSTTDASTFTKGNIKNQFVESSGQSFTESSITNNGDGTGSFALKAGANGRAEAQDGSVSFSGNTGGTATGTFDEDGVVEVERTGKANGRLENEEGNFSGNAKAEATQVSRKLVFDSSFKYAHSYVSSSCHMSSIDPQPRWNLCY